MPTATISGKKTIVLKAGYNEGGNNAEEGILATAVASPGMNVVRTTAVEEKGRHTYAPGATLAGGTAAAAAVSPVTLVKEDSLQGKTVSDAYAVGDTLLLHQAKVDDVCLVLVASGQTILKQDKAFAVASGKWNGATASINGVGEFLEASGGVLAADTLMRVKFY